MSSNLPVLRLAELALAEVRAHGGDGRIGFHRAFQDSDFASPVRFIDYAVLPPGTSIGRHRHGADEEIYLVLSGVGRMYRDGENFEVGPGTVIVNRSFGEHGLRNVGEEPLRLFVVEIGIPDNGEQR
ncbi:MAG: cupin domain-containing protein [Planctomycetes bacterium]|nr:cupin domain-containing protein [Planctomycetota bacterium]